MRKAVLILAIAGGALGIVNSIVFYVGGVLTSFLMTHFFIPFLYLTSLDEAFERLIIINAAASSILCITAAVAGIIYYIGDSNEREKRVSKYAATIVLIAVSVGLLITISFISVILIAIPAVLASLSVREDKSSNLIPSDHRLGMVIKITVVASVVVLVILGFLSAPLITGNIPVE